MTGWTEKRLGDCVTFLSGGTPARSNPEFWNGEIPWASNKDMKVGRLHDTIEHISADAAKSSSKLVPANTLLLVVRGMALAKTLPIAITQRTMAFNQDLKALEPKAGISGAFLYYWFVANAEFVLSKADEAAHGTKRLQTPALEDLVIRLPKEYREQEQIVSYLAVVDDWIENCERRIHLLEEAAQLIYTEWFVLRRPPHGQARRTPKSDWHETKLETVTSYINRGIAPSYDEGSPRLVINQRCIRDGQLDLEPARTLSNDIPDEKLLQVGDLLINSTGTGTLGRVAQVRQALDAATVDTHVTIVRPKPDIPIHFFGQQLLRLEGHFESLGEGATNQTELKRDRVKETSFLQPPQQLMIDFDDHVRPMMEQVEILRRQITQLRQARDLLLPRLISGQLRL